MIEFSRDTWTSGGSQVALINVTRDNRADVARTRLRTHANACTRLVGTPCRHFLFPYSAIYLAQAAQTVSVWVSPATFPRAALRTAQKWCPRMLITHF